MRVSFGEKANEIDFLEEWSIVFTFFGIFDMTSQ